MGSLLRFVEGKMVDFFDQTGFVDLVGGRRAVAVGLRELRTAALPLYAELLQVQDRKEPLASAVFDERRYPHLTKVHGWLLDVLSMPVPAPLLPWIRRLTGLAPMFDEARVHRILGLLAFRTPGVAERAFGRLVFFEMLCLVQRLELLRAGVDLEVMLGRREDVEALAERELVKAETQEDYKAALVELNDPAGMVRVIFGVSVASLDAHVEQLRAEIAVVGKEIAEKLEIRQRVLRALDGTEPTDAILIRNAFAEAFGEERITVEQMRLRHPGLLGDVSSDAARKRLERALARAPKTAGNSGTETLGKFLVRSFKELES